MKCFRCDGRDFDIVKHSLFGVAVIKCSNCSQQFFVLEGQQLAPVELLGSFEDIENECIIIKCNFCDTQRHISIDCTDLNMQCCGFCNYETKPVGNKIPLSEFLKRPSSIEGDTPVS